MERLLIFIAILFISVSAAAQTPVADFVAPSQVCRGQNLLLQNESTGAVRYQWDFCAGDLSETPTASLAVNLAGNITAGIEVVHDGTEWFGFVTSQNTNELIRLDFGTDLNAVPQVHHLGDFNGIIKFPQDVEIVKVGDAWHAFIYGNENVITRVDFGSKLTNTVTTDEPASGQVLITNGGSTNGGIEMVNDDGKWYLIMTDNQAIKIIRLNTITSVPSTDDIKSTLNPYANEMGDIVMTKNGENYFGHVVSFGFKNLQQLSFGSNVFSIPTFETIVAAMPSSASPYGLDGGYDKGEYFLFIVTLGGNFMKMNLGADLSQSPTPTDLGKLTKLENTLKFKLVNDSGKWVGFSPAWSSTNLYRVNFPDPDCEQAGIFTEEEPLVSFEQSGTVDFTLSAFDQAGNSSHENGQVEITSDQAPALDILVDNTCITQSAAFSVGSDDVVDVTDWNFGDGNSSTDHTPVHQFAAAGQYEVMVSGSASNGCGNFTKEVIEIYAEPSAAFTLPSGLTCTNNGFTFENETPDDGTQELVYQWQVNNIPKATTRDFDYVFTDDGSYDITLIASNPGCEDEVVKSITILTGPFADFNIEGNCADAEIEFENVSTGEIDAFSWILPDGTLVTSEHATGTFDPGNYSITLTALGTNGCETIRTKEFTVNGLPKSDFQIFPSTLCSGSPVDFKELATVPAGEAIATWNWSFGDESSSTSENASHVFLKHGDHKIKLRVTTEAGCTHEKERTVVVNKSPSTDFEFSTACMSVAGVFTPEENDALSYLWTIGDKIYQTKQPAHTFRTDGDHTVSLKVSAKNGCHAMASHMVSINTPVTPEYLAEKNCAGEHTIFHNITQSNDPVVSSEWSFDGILKEGESVSHSWPTSGEKSFDLVVATEDGCIYSSTHTVIILQEVKAEFIASPEIGSPPAEVAFINNSENADTFFWSFGDGASSELAAPVHTYTATGNYEIQLNASNAAGCDDQAARNVIISSPAPNASIAGISYSDNPDGTIKVVVSIENTGNTVLKNVPMTIDISGQIILTEIISEAVLPQARYNFALPYGLQRSDDLTFVCAAVKLEADISNEDNRSCIQFAESVVFLPGYPNPAVDFINVDWIGQTDETIQITLLNSMGKIASQFTVPSAEGFNNKTIDTRNLGRGVYLLILETPAKKTSQHIVVGD
jgi:PKD repeat protein